MGQEVKLCPKMSMPQKKQKTGIRRGKNTRHALGQVWDTELVVVGWGEMGGSSKATDAQVEN